MSEKRKVGKYHTDTELFEVLMNCDGEDNFDNDETVSVISSEDGSDAEEATMAEEVAENNRSQASETEDESDAEAAVIENDTEDGPEDGNSHESDDSDVEDGRLTDRQPKKKRPLKSIRLPSMERFLKGCISVGKVDFKWSTSHLILNSRSLVWAWCSFFAKWRLRRSRIYLSRGIIWPNIGVATNESVDQ